MNYMGVCWAAPGFAPVAKKWKMSLGHDKKALFLISHKLKTLFLYHDHMTFSTIYILSNIVMSSADFEA